MRRLVAEEWKAQGHEAGWRPILAALAERQEKEVSRRLVEEALRCLKAVRRHLLRERIREVRLGLEVVRRDAIWGEDAAYVGRKEAERVDVEVIQDPASGRTIGLGLGPSATEEAVVAGLEEAAKERGGLPLVLQTDRGGAYRGPKLAAYLEANRVVHVFSRPQTPTDNPRTERAIGSLRRESGIEGGGREVDLEAVREAFAAARQMLDEGRRLARHGYRRAKEVDAELVRADREVNREGFYREATEAMRRAGEGRATAREAWQAERVAVFGVMEEHHLVKVRRGAPARAGGREPGGTRERRRPARGAAAAARSTGSDRGPVALGEILGDVLAELGLGARVGQGVGAAAAGSGRAPSGGCAGTPGALCSG